MARGVLDPKHWDQLSRTARRPDGTLYPPIIVTAEPRVASEEEKENARQRL